jgi:AcrR family transcriptional regulator
MDDVAPPNLSLSLTARILARQPDDKARAVLSAAFETFLQFGVKRTAMQDIADRAGMSRAALYLHYRNKDDIFAALMAGYFEAAADAASEALALHDDPVDALQAGFAAQSGDAAERMMDSPHAEEMLATKLAAARDAVVAGETRLVAVYAEWLDHGVMADRLSRDAVGDDPAMTAAAMLAAVMGLKQAGLRGAGYTAARDRLAHLFGQGLRRDG